MTAKLTDKEIKRGKIDDFMQSVDCWASFYRANPHRFVMDYLGIKLYLFQQIVICEMFKVANTIFLASRGLSKTFTSAVFAVAYCILYPGTYVCVASKTRGQGSQVLLKIRDILMMMSPNLRLEISEIKVTAQDAYVLFKNGSKIAVVTAGDSARSNRATILFVDEYRLVDKMIIDTVLRKFLTVSRRPGFMDKPEYKNYPLERTKQIYASSCWYEAHWSYELVRSYVENMIRGRNFFCCAFPYQLAIKENLLDRAMVEDEMSESTFNSVVFQMEMETLFFGQNADGLYGFEDINKNRKILFPFLPKFKNYKLSDKRLYAPPKHPKEIRLLSADIALMASSKTKNDATSIFINQMVPLSNDRYVSNIVYTENNEGLRTDAQALAIRKLFQEFDCDYLIIDVKGIGLGVVDTLMTDIYDPTTGETYEAISCCNNEEIAKRCAVQNARKVIWAIQGSSEFNSRCALGLREALKQGQIRLLISEYDAEESLSDIKGYTSLSPGELLDLKLPYINTTLLVNELINLEYETRDGVVRVSEKPGMRKDRYSSLGYNIYVAKEIERKRKKSNLRNKPKTSLKLKTPVIKISRNGG